jgi:hypothetical protein
MVGFRVGLRFVRQGSGYWVKVRVYGQGSGFRVEGFWHRVQDLGFRVDGLESKAHN